MSKPAQTLIVTLLYQEIAKSWQMSRLEDDVYSFGLILLQSIVGPSVSAREEAFLRDELVRLWQYHIHKPELNHCTY